MSTTPMKVSPAVPTARTEPGKEYLALQIYAAIGRLMGWATILAAPIAFVVIQNTSTAAAFGVLFARLVAGAGEVAFAELLLLFVRLQGNTQYICDRLAALERLARDRTPPTPEIAPPRSAGIVEAKGG